MRSLLWLFYFPTLLTPKKTLEQKCTSDTASSYRGDDNHKRYVFDVENNCEFRLRRELNVAIFNAFGITKGRKSVVIAPHTHKTMSLSVKVFGGLNDHHHSCKQV